MFFLLLKSATPDNNLFILLEIFQLHIATRSNGSAKFSARVLANVAFIDRILQTNPAHEVMCRIKVDDLV